MNDKTLISFDGCFGLGGKITIYQQNAKCHFGPLHCIYIFTSSINNFLFSQIIFARLMIVQCRRPNVIDNNKQQSSQKKEKTFAIIDWPILDILLLRKKTDWPILDVLLRRIMSRKKMNLNLNLSLSVGKQI